MTSCCTELMSLQVDAIVTSVNQVGFFADAGPLPLFVSAHVSSAEPETQDRS